MDFRQGLRATKATLQAQLDEALAFENALKREAAIEKKPLPDNHWQVAHKLREKLRTATILLEELENG